MTFSTLNRRTPLRRVSAKRAARDAEWAETSKRLLRERPRCEALALVWDGIDRATDGLGNVGEGDYAELTAVMRKCWGQSSEVHHVLQRSLGGTDDDANLLAVCSPCHQWAHDHIELSTRLSSVGRCCRCGRALTDPESRARGYGSECARSVA